MQEHIMQFFAYEHLPPHLQEISKPFGDLAQAMVRPAGMQPDGTFLTNPLALPANEQRTLALTLLLQAKDAAVRARLAKDPPAT